MNIDSKKWKLQTDPVSGLVTTVEDRETGHVKTIDATHLHYEKVARQTEREFNYDCELAFEKGRWPR